MSSSLRHARCGGKMHMGEREWELARNDFFEAFKNYDEASGSSGGGRSGGRSGGGSSNSNSGSSKQCEAFRIWVEAVPPS